MTKKTLTPDPELSTGDVTPTGPPMFLLDTEPAQLAQDAPRTAQAPDAHPERQNPPQGALGPAGAAPGAFVGPSLHYVIQDLALATSGHVKPAMRAGWLAELAHTERRIRDELGARMRHARAQGTAARARGADGDVVEAIATIAHLQAFLDVK